MLFWRKNHAGWAVIAKKHLYLRSLYPHRGPRLSGGFEGL